MNLAATIAIYGYGTSEGVTKSWDTRGRGQKGILDQTRDEYSGAKLFKGFSKEITDEEQKQFQEIRSKEKEWTNASLQAISEGKLSPALAHERGLPTYAMENFIPLPSTLFHVTMAADKVENEGLKSRAEQKVGEGGGLGGGNENTISFTSDPKIADAIYQGLHEMRAVARGELTVDTMLKMAQQSIGAPKSWEADLRKYGDTAIGMDALLRGVIKEQDIAGEPPDDKHDWIPTKDSYHWKGGDGKERYTTWERKATEDEQRDRAVSFYKYWSSFREAAGGHYDPLFFLSDTKALAATKPENIKIFQVKPIQGAMGTRESAMGEYRTYSGKAVNIVRGYQPKVRERPV
jgi:hypothetical protein